MLTVYLVAIIVIGVANALIVALGVGIIRKEVKAKPAPQNDLQTINENQVIMSTQLTEVFEILKQSPRVNNPVESPKEVDAFDILKSFPYVADTVPSNGNGNGNGNGHSPKPEKTPEQKAAFAKRLADGKAKAKAKREAESNKTQEVKS